MYKPIPAPRPYVVQEGQLKPCSQPATRSLPARARAARESGRQHDTRDEVSFLLVYQTFPSSDTRLTIWPVRMSMSLVDSFLRSALAFLPPVAGAAASDEDERDVDGLRKERTPI